MTESRTITPIGYVRQGDRRLATITLEPRCIAGLLGIVPGEYLDIAYWMHELPSEQSETLQAHPRGDPERLMRGVFGLRSPMRPNPIGVTRAVVREVAGDRLTVHGLDARPGSPVIDIKSAPAAALRAVIAAWGGVHDAMTRAILTAQGDAACNTLWHEPMRRVGAAAAPPADSPLTPAAIGAEIMHFESHWEIRGRILQNTPDSFVREVDHCPWADFHPTSCRVLGWYMEGFVAAANPACVYDLARIPHGGSSRKAVACCQYRASRARWTGA